MLCKKPFMVGGELPVACNTCLHCRINRRRVWSHRLVLESSKHQASSFVTLTYSGELPGYGHTLYPSDSTNFLKRLRQALAPFRIRFFLVGEYGERGQRAHYHALLFGFPSCRRGQTEYPSKRSQGDDCCDVCSRIFAAWGLGRIQSAGFSLQSAHYCAGYVTKKMKFDEDYNPLKSLKGRHPEFGRMSLRPGIGASAMLDVATALETKHGYKHLRDTGTVPSSLQCEGKTYPLGTYLKGKLYEAINPAGLVPETLLVKINNDKPLTDYQIKMRALQIRARVLSPSITPKEVVLDAFKGRRARAEALQKIYSIPRTL